MNNRNLSIICALATFISLNANAQTSELNQQNDGTITIKAHTHTATQNSLHEKFCNNIGGIDITDNSDISVGPNTMDAIFCKITDNDKFTKTIPYAMVGNVDNDGMPILSNKLDSDVVDELSKFNSTYRLGSYRVIVTGGTVNKNQPWYATSVGYYDGVTGTASVYTTAPAVGCNGNPTQMYLQNQYQPISATMQCKAVSINSTPIYGHACLNGGGCAQHQSTVYFN